MKGDLFYCKSQGEGTAFKVHLTPRSSREAVEGTYQDALRVKIKAPPVDGKANEALRKFMAVRLGVSASRLEIIAGQTSRIKLLHVEGLTPEEVQGRLTVKASH